MTAVSRSCLAFTCALFGFATLAAPGLAHADNARADALFREGRTLLDAKRYDDACPKLTEAQKEAPGAGTLLALALCHEGQGKTASAWTELNEAAAVGKGVGRNDLAAAASKRAQAMEPTLSKLVVRLPPGEEPTSFDVKCDGEHVDAAALGTPLPVDPGEHRILVAQSGKIARTYAVRLSGAGVVEIVIDKLEDERTLAVAPRPRAVAPIRLTAATSEAAPAAEDKPGKTQRVLGIAVIGLGVVGIGTGAYFGARALSQRADGENSCPKTPCAASANDANERAKSSFAMSVTSVAAGTGAIAIGTVIYLLAPDSPNAQKANGAPPARTARLVPEVSPSQMGMGVSGTF